MMEHRIGILGTEKTGLALLRGMIGFGSIPASNIYLYDTDQEKLRAICLDIGVNAADSSAALVGSVDVVILAVEPEQGVSFLEAMKDALDGEKILVTLTAGISLKSCKDIIGEDRKVIRAVTNLPALAGEAMTLLSCGSYVSADEFKQVQELFKSIGRVEVLDEKLMTEIGAMTASAPAYVLAFIEALGDAGIRSGIPQELVPAMAAQAVLGSAKVVLETGRHPAELKDQVCSPAGTTIEAVASLEKDGFRYAIMEAMDECAKKAKCT